MKIAIAGDSAGVSLVEVLASYLAGCKGIEVSDLSRVPSGATEYYANVAERVANAILAKEFDRKKNLKFSAFGAHPSLLSSPASFASFSFRSLPDSVESFSRNFFLIMI